MADRLQAVKGMNDALPPETAKWNFVERRCRAVLESHGYREIRTPLCEYTQLFARSIGEATDIVEKEMYTFDDRDGRSLTLRPEGTAGVVRAYIEHSIAKSEPVSRWYYIGPMYRHERMQKGRYRQFTQVGCEVFGIAEPTIDAELCAMLAALLQDLGVQNVTCYVNSLGRGDDRTAYREALTAYLEGHVEELCEDCRRRLGQSPLRVLDCKVAGCAAVAANAPAILDHLGEASRAHFDGVRRALEALEVRYEVDPHMVRGLDYYTGTIFELRGEGGTLGSQNAICGGGRYDGLVEQLGGPATPAVGFAMGLERLALVVPGEPETFEPGLDVFLAHHGDEARLWALTTAERIRRLGYRADMDHRQSSMKTQLKRADRLHARLVLVAGEQEIAARKVALRDMASGTQREIAADDLDAEIKRSLA
ncbi:MAG: histidine--tRNA ligase [Deltaproteobacteria bacterium]|nr:histidine--tRNA ligase [Deltaproteobacteria bacterium]